MRNILTINGGSSRFRFAIFAAEHPPRRLLQGKMERTGGGDADLIVATGVDRAIRKRICDGLGFLGIDIDIATLTIRLLESARAQEML